MDKIKGKKGVAGSETMGSEDSKTRGAAVTKRRRVWRGQQDDGWARGRVNMSFDWVR